MVALSHPQPSTEHPLVAAMRTVTEAQAMIDGIEFADLTEPGNRYEALHFAKMDEVSSLRLTLAAFGIDADALSRALS